MQTGIIYQAFNTISKKSYIGQTKRALKQRIKEHYNDTKRRYYKFPRALNKYKSEDWEWIILIETEVCKLNDYEDYYIALFNSYKNGYNSRESNQNIYPAKSKLILKVKPKYKIYHPDYGIIEETTSELSKRNITLGKYISDLVSGRLRHIHGYVLASNKNNYDDLLNLHKFYNPKFGVVKCTPTELDRNYLYLSRKEDLCAYLLTRETVSIYHGWILYKNKDKYTEFLFKNTSLITMEHNVYGILSMRMFEFYEKFNLLISDIQKLKRKEIDSISDWRLVSNK